MILHRALAALCLTSLAIAPTAADDVLEDHARRGAIFERLTAASLTPDACAALCSADNSCRSWVWTRAELTGTDPGCALLSATPTPYRAPGQVTGLSQSIADQIESATERPPSDREIRALQANSARPQ